MGLDLTGFGSVADFAGGILDRIWPKKMNQAEKAHAQIELQKMIEDRDNSLLSTQKSIIVAELNQGDNFTKRARPSIVYFGLFAIGLVHVVLPVVAWITIIVTGKPLTDMPNISLPSQFWMTWGGVCSVWMVGRSFEKKGSSNKMIDLITGK